MRNDDVNEDVDDDHDDDDDDDDGDDDDGGDDDGGGGKDDDGGDDADDDDDGDDDEYRVPAPSSVPPSGHPGTRVLPPGWISWRASCGSKRTYGGANVDPEASRRLANGAPKRLKVSSRRPKNPRVRHKRASRGPPREPQEANNNSFRSVCDRFPRSRMLGFGQGC